MGPNVMQEVLLDRARVHGPMLAVCPAPGCATLTMGGTCVEHDPPVQTAFPRGRPYVGKPTSPTDHLRVVGESLPEPPG